MTTCLRPTCPGASESVCQAVENCSFLHLPETNGIRSRRPTDGARGRKGDSGNITHIFVKLNYVFTKYFAISHDSLGDLCNRHLALDQCLQLRKASFQLPSARGRKPSACHGVLSHRHQLEISGKLQCDSSRIRTSCSIAVGQPRAYAAVSCARDFEFDSLA